MKIYQIICSLILVLFITCCATFTKITNLTNEKQIDINSGNYWMSAFSEVSGLNYIITFPKEYNENTNKTWPLIIFLHSLAERGTNIQLVMQNGNNDGNDKEGDGISAIILPIKSFQFITISPLCSEGTGWPLLNDRLDLLLKDITNKYRINIKRIYLTGVSMGGMGTWSFAMSHPDWFAAIAPISGGIYTPPMIENISAITNIPVWAFHDFYDPDIPLSAEQNTIIKLKKAGEIVKYSISFTGKHYIHADIYKNSDLFRWFLENEKK